MSTKFTSKNLTNRGFLIFHREFNLLTSLDHESIVKYYDLIETNYVESEDLKIPPMQPSLDHSPSPTSSLKSFSSIGIKDGKFYLIMEWLGDGCNLTNWISNTKCDRRIESIRFILKKLFEAAEYLAKKEISHHDIKLDNVIFHEESKSLKLIDFGVSEYCPGDESFCSHGTPAYQAPEILTRSDPSEPISGHKSDIWSIGIVAYQLANSEGKLPFEGDSVMQVLDGIIRNEPDYSVLYPKFIFLKDLIQKLLQKNPKKRLSASEALFHPFITGQQNRKEMSLNKVISKIKNFFTL